MTEPEPELEAARLFLQLGCFNCPICNYGFFCPQDVFERRLTHGNGYYACEECLSEQADDSFRRRMLQSARKVLIDMEDSPGRYDSSDISFISSISSLLEDGERLTDSQYKRLTALSSQED